MAPNQIFSAMPAQAKEAWFRSNFKLGSVLHFYHDFIRNPKVKYSIVVSIEPVILLMIINTSLPVLALNRREVRAHQLVMRLSEHPFMEWDSHLDCSDIHQIDLEKIRGIIYGDTDRIAGQVSEPLIKQIIKVLKKNDLVDPIDSKRIVDQLSTFL